MERLSKLIGPDDKSKFDRLSNRHVPVITRRESAVRSDASGPDASARFTPEATAACAQHFCGYHTPERRWPAFYRAADVVPWYACGGRMGWSIPTRTPGLRQGDVVRGLSAATAAGRNCHCKNDARAETPVPRLMRGWKFMTSSGVVGCCR